MLPGLHIKSVHLNKAICFNKAEFTFTPGVTVIYGLNRTNARTSGNGNGAGKSAFFSQIGEVLYESPIVGEKQDAVRGGGRTLKTIMREKRVNIKRNGGKLNIKIDGVDNFRTKPMAKAWLRDNNPINQEEFNTYVHIDARIPHPLVMGSSVERRRFFTSFFGLDKMDVERRLFTAELAKLGKVRAGYSEVLREYKTAKERAVSPEEMDELKAEVKEGAERLEDLNAKNTRLQNISQLLTFEETARPQLKVLAQICPAVTAEAFDEVMAESKRTLKQNQADLEDALAWEQYQRDTAHYDEALSKLPADAARLITKLGLKDARLKCVKAYEELATVSEQVVKYEAVVKANSRVLKDELPAKVKPPEKDKKALRARLESLTHQYDHARQFKTGSCHTCGQSVAVKNPAKLKAEMESIEALLEQFDAALAYKEARAAYNEAWEACKEAETKLAHLAECETKLGRYACLHKHLRNMPRRPAKFEGKKVETKIKQRMVDEDKERMQLLNFLRPNLDTIIALNALTPKQRGAGSMADKLQARINEIHEKLSKKRAQLEVNSLVMENVKRLRSRLKEMKADLVNEEPLRLLVEAYSDKAMKRMAIKSISNRLMLEVNKYARAVFPEDYTFEFAWDTSQLSLIVHRKYGKKTLPSDVRKLSGAESKLFTIVLVLALLTFVPRNKRCNLLILDEPTANFSAETTDRFKALLPILNKVIPTIVIITPRVEERYEGATEWTMVKTGGSAALELGHPSILRKEKK